MGKTIMIVEDSSLMIAVITNFIKKEGDYEVITANDGQEAVDKYKKEKPSLVFMDIKMPGMDGITALEKIREFDKLAKIVMCTSLRETEQEQRAKKAGCSGYIMKPFSRQDIADAIKNNIKS